MFTQKSVRDTANNYLFTNLSLICLTVSEKSHFTHDDDWRADNEKRTAATFCFARALCVLAYGSDKTKWFILALDPFSSMSPSLYGKATEHFSNVYPPFSIVSKVVWKAVKSHEMCPNFTHWRRASNKV